MPVTIEKVLETDKQVLRNLYSLYLHDLSRFSASLDIGEDGRFPYEDIDLFWREEGICPFFIKHDGKIAGFVLILTRPFLKKLYDVSVNDIFVLNKYKGKGVGKQVMDLIFQQFHGKYFVVELAENKPAIAFWKKIYEGFNIEFEEREEVVHDEPCLIQTFSISLKDCTV